MPRALLPPELRAWLESQQRPDLSYYLENATLRARPRPFQELPEPLQRRVFLLNRKVRPRVGECYRNALRGLVQDPAAAYVEGVCTGPHNPTPVPHAWLELDGETVDLTLWGDPRQDYPLPGYDYYGVSFPTEEVLRAALVHECIRPMARL